MFYHGFKLTSLNLSNSNTNNVNKINEIFIGLNENCNVIILDIRKIRKINLNI